MKEEFDYLIKKLPNHGKLMYLMLIQTHLKHAVAASKQLNLKDDFLWGVFKQMSECLTWVDGMVNYELEHLKQKEQRDDEPRQSD